jgi:hypothetical protein
MHGDRHLLGEAGKNGILIPGGSASSEKMNSKGGIKNPEKKS